MYLKTFTGNALLPRPSVDIKRKKLEAAFNSTSATVRANDTALLEVGVVKDVVVAKTTTRLVMDFMMMVGEMNVLDIVDVSEW
jgi:hypothetical protein